MKNYNKKDEYIDWKGGQLNLSLANAAANELVSFDWKLKKWETQPALIDNKSGSSQLYSGQKYNEKCFNLVNNGWTHDHCEICSWTISSLSNDSADDEAYYNGENWICIRCYNRFLKPLMQKVSNVFELKPADRYEYFIRKIADFEKIWSIRQSDGWATMGDKTGNIIYPFFPEKTFAILMIKGKWADYNSESIELSDFINKWLPGMIEDKIELAIIPTPGNNGIIYSPDKVLHDLNNEIEQYN